MLMLTPSLLNSLSTVFLYVNIINNTNSTSNPAPKLNATFPKRIASASVRLPTFLRASKLLISPNFFLNTMRYPKIENVIPSANMIIFNNNIFLTSDLAETTMLSALIHYYYLSSNTKRQYKLTINPFLPLLLILFGT